MVVLAFLSDPAAVRKILEPPSGCCFADLKLPTAMPPLAPSRLSQDDSLVLADDWRFEDEPAWPPTDRRSLGARAPP